MGENDMVRLVESMTKLVETVTVNMSDIRERVVRIETKIDGFKDVGGRIGSLEKNHVECKANTNSELKICKDAILKIQDTNKWAFRTAVGAAVVAAISTIREVLINLVK